MHPTFTHLTHLYICKHAVLDLCIVVLPLYLGSGTGSLLSICSSDSVSSIFCCRFLLYLQRWWWNWRLTLLLVHEVVTLSCLTSAASVASLTGWNLWATALGLLCDLCWGLQCFTSLPLMDLYFWNTQHQKKSVFWQASHRIASQHSSILWPAGNEAMLRRGGRKKGWLYPQQFGFEQCCQSVC